MEPDVIRMYSSSPPPMEEGAEEDDDEFSDFAGVPSSISFTEFDTPTTFNQLQALNATSPPELIGNGRVVGRGPAKPNGSVPCSGQGDGAPCRTVTMEELKKTLELPHGTYTNFTDVSATARTGSDAIGRNGNVGGVEVLTNGFATFDGEETSPSCRKHREDSPSVDYHPGAVANDDDEEFADFSAFSDVDFPSHFDQESGGGADWEDSNLEGSLAEDNVNQPPGEGELGASVGSVVVEGGEDACVTGFVSLAFSTEASGCLSNGDWGFHAGAGHEQEELKADNSHKNSNTAESISTEPLNVQNSVAQNGLEVQETVDNRVSPGLEDERGRGSEQPEERGSGNDTETETETETSFGRPLSTDALEEFGDFSTTGSVPSPPLQEETATPADHSQLAEDDDEDFADFGDFGDASSFGATGFADFDQQGAAVQKVPSEPASQANLETTCANEDEYGDFDAPKDPSHAVQEAEDSGAQFAGFPGSDSFADFSSAPVDGGGDVESEWQAFNDPASSQGVGGSWAAFGHDHSPAFSQNRPDDWREDQADLAPPTGSAEDRRKNSITASLFHRLEKLFLASFPEACVPQVGAPVPPLRAFLEPMNQSEPDENPVTPTSGALQDVWRQLQDIHNAFGLRHQWGGSHSNKTLLCSLGIDTRNILFTGQKKQPVIVPMYAASLGMLEPTKEPVKPVSAAEMIASIAQSPTVATEMGTCRTDAVQEPLPPVQFDWSSSGLTNPLDASGGSSLLNLDFFGPVDESLSSSATSIPGVDPELYELTQAKMEVGGGNSRVADAFARLMSTVEKTNTSTRRAQVRKEENHSEEARRVIASLPDLSFMQAKVLMFPSTLTPLPLSSSSSSPVPD